MNFTRNRPEGKFLSTLKYGDVFELENKIYMLIHVNEVYDYNQLPCVRLSTGYVKYISGDAFVIPYYDAELRY